MIQVSTFNPVTLIQAWLQYVSTCYWRYSKIYSLGDLFLRVYPYQDLDVPKDEAATELGSICYTVPTTDVQHKIIPQKV
jgi:hypothetical protein